MGNLYTKLIRSLLVIAAMGIATTLTAQTYCIPSYSGPGYIPPSGVPSGQASSFYTHILNVQFGTINQSTGSPFGNPANTYNDYTFISTDIAPSVVYPITISVGNGANPQAVAVWIDFNQDKTFAANERVFFQTDPANVGNHILTGTVSVPATAKLGPTRMRVGTRFGSVSPGPCTNNDASTATLNWSHHFQDFTVDVKSPVTQVYQSANIFHPTQDEVNKSTANNVIIGIEVVTNADGVLSPLTAGDFEFSTLGTTNTSEILNAKLFYTGLRPDFATTTQVGTTIASMNGNFIINAGQKLQPGKNYFWLTYDIASAPVLGNKVDARCNAITVSTKRIPNNISPAGFRPIGYCVSKGSQNWFINVESFNFGSINNNTPWFFTPGAYGNYTYLSNTIWKNRIDTFRFVIGNSVNPAQVRVWMDFNQDGDFDDFGETVLDSFWNASQFNPRTTPMWGTLPIPSGAKVGPTRLRISCQNANLPSPCTNPVQIGEVEDYTIVIADSGQPVANFLAGVTCKGNPTYFFDNSSTFGSYSINDWDWNFGDPASGTADTSSSQSPSHTFTKAGIYNVTLTVNTNKPGATPSTIIRAVAVDSPNADFIFNPNVKQTPISFVDQSLGGEIVTWNWNFGDSISAGSNTSTAPYPLHVYDSAGTYNVRLIVRTTGGCFDTLDKAVTILNEAVPVADFTASTFNPYVGAGVNFVDISQFSPKSWKWKISPAYYRFLNGTSDTSQNPVIAFDSLTIYTIYLLATNGAGTDSIGKSLTTKPYQKPIASFFAFPDSIRAGQSTLFVDQSLNDPTNYLWDFGDPNSGTNNSSTLRYPSHQYDSIGVYAVKLTVSNPAGSDDTTVVKAVKVTNTYNLCEPGVVNTNARNGNLYDSGGSTGDYQDNNNCGLLIKPNCSGPITFTFTTFSYATNDYLQLFDGENDTVGIPLHSGLGFTGASLPPIVVAKSGALYVKEVTDGFGTSAGFSGYWTSTPNTAPVAAINADTVGYVNGITVFNNITSGGTANTYRWDFDGDGTNDSIATNGRFRYTTTGTYQVRLVATNCAGTDTVYQTIHIVNPTVVPIANFKAVMDTVELDEIFQLLDLSQYGPTSWRWTFGNPGNVYFWNNTTDTTQEPFISFDMTGPQTICLEAINAIGSSVVVCKMAVYVKEKRVMCLFPFTTDAPRGRIYDSGDRQFNYQNNENCNQLIEPCAKKAYLRFNYFSFAPGDVLRVYDGNSAAGVPLHPGTGFSGSTNPGMLVSNSGSFYLVEVTNNNTTAAGFEADWWTESMDRPEADFTAPKFAYAGANTHFFNTGSLVTGTQPVMHDWDFDGDMIPDQTSQNGTWVFPAPGIYQVSLFASNCAGIDTFTQQITVLAPSGKPTAGFYTDYLTVGVGEIVNFVDTSANAPTSIEWIISNPGNHTPVNGTSYTDGVASIQFNAAGTYDVCLVATNAFGADTLCRTAHIRVLNYCQPIASFNPGVGITQVAIGTLADNSTITGGYLNKVNGGKTASLEHRSTNTITLQRNTTTSQSWKAWIDFNQDGVFDVLTEEIMNVTANTATSASATFKVPGWAQMGNTRLRVAVAAGASSFTPCGATLAGEYEDYRVMIVPDDTKPVITLLGANPDTLQQGTLYAEPGYFATDNADGIITASVAVRSNLDNLTLGTYWASYHVTDSAGNAADSAVRVIHVVPDFSAPVISLTDGDSIFHQVKYAFTDPGYSALDNVDGNLTDSVKVTGFVNVNVVGVYQLYYNVKDNNGNAATTKTRIVFVGDTIPPVITLKGPGTIDHKLNEPYIDSGVIVTDNYFSNITPNVVGTVDITQFGANVLTYEAVDSLGNTAITINRVVLVYDPNIGMAEKNLLTGLLAYPNPAADKVQVIVTAEPEGELVLVNMLGQEVLRRPMQSQAMQLDVSNFSAGLYMLRWESSGLVKGQLKLSVER